MDFVCRALWRSWDERDGQWRDAMRRRVRLALTYYEEELRPGLGPARPAEPGAQRAMRRDYERWRDTQPAPRPASGNGCQMDAPRGTGWE